MEENSTDVMDGATQTSTLASFQFPLKQKNGRCEEDCRSNGATNGHCTTTKTKPEKLSFSESDTEMIRLMAQHLHELGLAKTAESLIAESGVEMEPANASRFRQHVMDGCWEEAERSLSDLMSLITTPAGYKKMLFLLREQKFLENVQDGRLLEALRILRTELTPLEHNISRVHELSCCLMCNGRQSLCTMAKWEGKGQTSRQNLLDNLQSFLPPTVMLPPKRLRCIVNQALAYQMTNCELHNAPVEFRGETVEPLTSLLYDHQCTRDDFPAETSQTLLDHCDEVWCCQFSSSGRKLATGSKDCKLIIWDVDLTTGKVSRNQIIEGHGFGVSVLQWSPDEMYIAACGPDEKSEEVWVWNAQTGDVRCKVSIYAEDTLTTVAWHKDSKRFVTGGTRGQFYLCDLDGKALETWEGVRVITLAVRPNGQILASDTHNRIRAYDFDEAFDKHLLDEDRAIMYFSCDRTGRYALLNVANQGIHLWDLEDKALVRRYQGLTQGYSTINSCFGGCDEKFIASGSEDFKVYVWNIHHETPVAVLSGHNRGVNCVHWNPALPSMLASVSDDSSVRIWMPKKTGAGSSASTPLQELAY